MIMYKFDPYRIYKFGETGSEDVLERFNLEVHASRKWKNIPLARDYNVQVLWSMWVTKDRAISAEAWFKKEYPLNFFFETNYNGKTECRYWTVPESYNFTSLLDKNFPKTEEYWETISKLKEDRRFFKANYRKIYFIMSTKKQ